MEKTKPFNIPKQLFVEAYKLVKANAGAAGVDQESLDDFARNLKDNLYKLWNRMSSMRLLQKPFVFMGHYFTSEPRFNSAVRTEFPGAFLGAFRKSDIVKNNK